MGKKGKADVARRPAPMVNQEEPMVQRVHAVLGYLLLAPALLPLLFVPQFHYPYLAPKTLAFRAFGMVVLAALVYLILARRELHFGRLKRGIAWIPAALLVVAYATSLFGIGFYRSFWSTFERGDGLLTLTVEVLFFYAILLHADARFMRRLAALSMWVGGLVALYACLQWLRIVAGMEGTDRAGSTLGNPTFMASYLGMTFFLTLWRGRDCRSRWRVLVWVSAVTQLLAVVLSGTRGTMLALVLAGILAAAYMAWRGAARLRLVARVSLAGVLALLAIYFIFRAQLALVPFVPVQRFAMISLTEQSVSTRLFLWWNLGREALHHPLAGVGAEHVYNVHNTVYDPDKSAEAWIDRSHNAYLDYLLQFGLPGALLYLALLCAALRTAYAAFKPGGAGGGYLFLLFVTYAAQNFFVFDTALTLWLFLAVLAALLAMEESAPRRLAIPNLHAAVRVVPALAILLLLLPVAIQPARANLLLARAYSYPAPEVRREADDLAEGLSLDTYGGRDYGHSIYSKYILGQRGKLDGEAQLLAYQLTLDVMTKSLARYPDDAATALFLVDVLYYAPVGATRDMALLNKAVDAAVRLSPRRQQGWYIRANLQIDSGDAAPTAEERGACYLAAAEILKEYAALQPSNPDVHYFIAGLYLALGDQLQAGRWADAGYAVYSRESGAADKAARYYLDTQQWAKARRFLEDILETAPADYASLYELARVKYQVGDRGGARAIVARLRSVSPTTLETDRQLLTAIEGGN